VKQSEGILQELRDGNVVVGAGKRDMNLRKEVKSMEKKELVDALAKKMKIDAARAELAVNEVVAQLASPYVFRKPGEEVAALINDCNNHCREELAMTEMKTPARGG
jgi:hypothetical protein